MSQNFVTPPSEAPPFVTASAFAQYSVAARLPPLESPRSPDESESDDDEPGFEQLENFQPGVPAAQALPFQPRKLVGSSGFEARKTQVPEPDVPGGPDPGVLL